MNIAKYIYYHQHNGRITVTCVFNNIASGPQTDIYSLLVFNELPKPIFVLSRGKRSADLS